MVPAWYHSVCCYDTNQSATVTVSLGLQRYRRGDTNTNNTSLGDLQAQPVIGATNLAFSFTDSLQTALHGCTAAADIEILLKDHVITQGTWQSSC